MIIGCPLLQEVRITHSNTCEKISMKKACFDVRMIGKKLKTLFGVCLVGSLLVKCTSVYLMCDVSTFSCICRSFKAPIYLPLLFYSTWNVYRQLRTVWVLYGAPLSFLFSSRWRLFYVLWCIKSIIGDLIMIPGLNLTCCWNR